MNSRRPSKPVATFFGGCATASTEEEDLAYHVGRLLGRLGFRLYHGGYNGLMEEAARGAAATGAPVVAVTLRDKQEWGDLNPYVATAVYTSGLGQRLGHLVEGADLVVAMAGGVGSLHELTAALWYAGNIRPVPVVILGPTAGRLLEFLRQERWLYESPTRPLDFLYPVRDRAELAKVVPEVAARVHARSAEPVGSLTNRIRQVAYVEEPYRLADGQLLKSYFDPFRLAADAVLSAQVARELGARVDSGIDAIVGVAVGGMALSATLATQLGLPLLVVRPQPKTYGTFSQVEGLARPGQRVLVVDDVVRTGRQMADTAGLLSKAGLMARDATCVVERSGAGRQLLRDHGITLTSLIAEEHASTPAKATAHLTVGGQEC